MNYKRIIALSIDALSIHEKIVVLYQMIGNGIHKDSVNKLKSEIKSLEIQLTNIEKKLKKESE